MAVTLRLTLAKVTGWLRWSASQPEPLIGKCDEDVLVVPPMLEAYATLLCNMSLHAGASMHGGREPAQVLAILTLNPITLTLTLALTLTLSLTLTLTRSSRASSSGTRGHRRRSQPR